MAEQSDITLNVHKGQPLLTAGEPLASARAAMLMLHGRGASAADILSFVEFLPDLGFAFLAPQAADHTWYPYSFLAPFTQNEPYLSSALETIEDLLARVRAVGIPDERIMILGFSQGACLGSEFVARHARRYGGFVAWTGGVAGPDGTPRDYPGSLAGTPIFLGSSDPDPHVPLARIKLTEEVFTRLGGVVTTHIYPGMPHTVNQDEIDFARGMMAALVAS
jgi:predicted esterase